MEREGTASFSHQPGLSALILERLPGSLHNSPVELVAFSWVGDQLFQPWGVYLAAEGCWMRKCLCILFALKEL